MTGATKAAPPAVTEAQRADAEALAMERMAGSAIAQAAKLTAEALRWCGRAGTLSWAEVNRKVMVAGQLLDEADQAMREGRGRAADAS